MTMKKLESILTERLSLKDPEYFLEKVGNRLVGNIVSTSFKGKDDYKRQQMLWDALDKALGPESAVLIGMLLAFTPDEWHLGEDDNAPSRKARKVG